MIDHIAKRSRDRCPTHPGEMLREDVPPALGMTVVEAAGALKVSRQALHRVLAGTAAVSPEMALRLDKLCGNGPNVWIRMQEAYDLWHAERKIAADLAGIETARAA